MIFSCLHFRSVGGVEIGTELEEDSEVAVPHMALPLVLPRATGTPTIEKNQFETGLTGGREEEREKEMRERLPSTDQKEVKDTLTPLSETVLPRKPFPLHRGSTTSSLRSTTSSQRREKPPPLLRNEPQHILRINARGISILPNVRSNEVSLRVSLSHVRLGEILASNDRERERIDPSANEAASGGTPTIRARIEIGSQVERFELPASQLTGKAQDIVAMLSIIGLRAALLAKNIAVVKDFFEDEFESDAPVPIQIHVEDTTFELREDICHTAENDNTMNVRVKSLDIHRGKQIQGTNLFQSVAMETDNPADEILSPNVEETLCFDSGPGIVLRDTSPAAQSSDSSTGANTDLIGTFRSFVSAFEAHLRRHGGLKVQLNQPEHIAGLLQELQVSLSNEEVESEKRAETEAPPTYFETLEQDHNSTVTGPFNKPSSSSFVSSSTQQRRQSLESPTLKSRATELRRLRRESQELARVQAENEDLISQLMQTKVLLAERSQDLDEVTSECKKTKDELVTHKQVLENYQEHIEKLLTENADLKMILTSLQSHQ